MPEFTNLVADILDELNYTLIQSSEIAIGQLAGSIEFKTPRLLLQHMMTC